MPATDKSLPLSGFTLANPCTRTLSRGQTQPSKGLFLNRAIDSARYPEAIDVNTCNVKYPDRQLIFIS